MTLRLIQLKHGQLRRVAVVEEPHLRLLEAESVYALVELAIHSGVKLSEAAKCAATSEVLDYGPVYDGDSEWRILPPIDHPSEPARCMISGTGLTHLGSARDRQAMHAHALTSEQFEELTDSMKMFRWGIDGGRPAGGSIGTS